MATTDLVTIAAVNGPAVGAGFDLVLGCDLRFGSRNARFAHTFIDLGIIPGDGGAWLLPRVVGWQRATELALTARFITSAEAEKYGVLLEVVEEQLMSKVTEVATEIEPRSAVTGETARRSPWISIREMSAAFQAVAHSTPEHEEAVSRFVSRLSDSDVACYRMHDPALW